MEHVNQSSENGPGQGQKSESHLTRSRRNVESLGLRGKLQKERNGPWCQTLQRPNKIGTEKASVG